MHDIFLSFHKHQRKNVGLCWLIQDMHARLKSQVMYTVLLVQLKHAWRRNTIPTTACHVNFGFVTLTSIVMWKEAKRKCILIWPTLPSTWLMKIGTNLCREEVFALEGVGFQLWQREALSLWWRLQTMPNLPIPKLHFHVRPNPYVHPNNTFSKTLQRNLATLQPFCHRSTINGRALRNWMGIMWSKSHPSQT